jgi:hypothetical protein
MRCLVAANDAQIRDQVAAAACAFEDVEVDVADVEDCRNMVRRRIYDFGFVALKSGSHESEALWDDLRQTAPDMLLVAMTPRSGMKVRRSDRGRFDLFALIGTPVDPVEVFRTLRRLIDRLTKSRTGVATSPK